MKTLKQIKLAKGVIYLFTFVLSGIFLYSEPNLGVMKSLTNIGIPASGWLAIFIVTGIANFLTGVYDWNWNMLWFSPIYMYTGATLIPVATVETFPTTPLILYLLLSLLTILDVWKDWTTRDSRG